MGKKRRRPRAHHRTPPPSPADRSTELLTAIRARVRNDQPFRPEDLRPALGPLMVRRTRRMNGETEKRTAVQYFGSCCFQVVLALMTAFHADSALRADRWDYYTMVWESFVRMWTAELLLLSKPADRTVGPDHGNTFLWQMLHFGVSAQTISEKVNQARRDLLEIGVNRALADAVRDQLHGQIGALETQRQATRRHTSGEEREHLCG